MTTSKLQAGFDAWIELLIAGAENGLVQVMNDMEQTAQATDAYRGVTGATRAATVGYVVGVNGEKFTEALQAAFERNPLHIASFNAPDSGPQSIIGILTVPTDYAILLERENAGQKAFLAESLLTVSAGAIETIAQVARKQLTGGH